MEARTGPASMSYWLAIPAAVLLVLAVFGRWPYGFYTLLRLLVCISAIYLLIKAINAGITAWAWIMGAVALLFNPVFTIHLRRSNWRVLDLLAAIAFVACVLAVRARGHAKAIHQGGRV